MVETSAVRSQNQKYTHLPTMSRAAVLLRCTLPAKKKEFAGQYVPLWHGNIFHSGPKHPFHVQLSLVHQVVSKWEQRSPHLFFDHNSADWMHHSKSCFCTLKKWKKWVHLGDCFWPNSSEGQSTFFSWQRTALRSVTWGMVLDTSKDDRWPDYHATSCCSTTPNRRLYEQTLPWCAVASYDLDILHTTPTWTDDPNAVVETQETRLVEDWKTKHWSFVPLPSETTTPEAILPHLARCGRSPGAEHW